VKYWLLALLVVPVSMGARAGERLSSAPIAASFDCTLATKPVEKMNCADADLAETIASR
jgi:uncharacterized protein